MRSKLCGHAHAIRMPDVVLEVLIPYVGRDDYLKNAVESLLSQSDPGWKVTVVEDGDQGRGVAEWLRRICDARITHELNPLPLGLAGNFQRCLDLAHADYVTFAGCDDAFLPGYVAGVRRLVGDHPAAGALIPSVRIMGAKGEIRRPVADVVKRRLAPRSSMTASLAGERVLASLMHGNWTYFPSICWRRDAISQFGFRQDLPTTLDLALLAQLLLEGHDVVVDGEAPTFLYRRHRASASSTTASDLGRFTEERRLFREIESVCRAREWPRAARAARWHATSRMHAATMLPRCLLAGDTRRAATVLQHLFSRSGAAATVSGRVP